MQQAKGDQSTFIDELGLRGVADADGFEGAALQEAAVDLQDATDGWGACEGHEGDAFGL